MIVAHNLSKNYSETTTINCFLGFDCPKLPPSKQGAFLDESTSSLVPKASEDPLLLAKDLAQLG